VRASLFRRGVEENSDITPKGFPVGGDAATELSLTCSRTARSISRATRSALNRKLDRRVRVRFAVGVGVSNRTHDDRTVDGDAAANTLRGGWQPWGTAFGRNHLGQRERPGWGAGAQFTERDVGEG